jgi:MinD superfamily P-loop ATPase
MKVDMEICMYCGVCVGLCPRGAVALTEDRVVFAPTCNSCSVCVKGCPIGAISRS